MLKVKYSGSRFRRRIKHKHTDTIIENEQDAKIKKQMA